MFGKNKDELTPDGGRVLWTLKTRISNKIKISSISNDINDQFFQHYITATAYNWESNYLQNDLKSSNI